MTSLSTRLSMAGLGCVMLFAVPALAQEESTNRVAAETDWSVFVEEEPSKACWSVSAPKESVATDAQGQVIPVRRGDILMFVSYLPGEGVSGQVSLTGGYPYKDDSAVTVEVDGRTFSLITVPDDDPATPNIAEDEYAWTSSDEDDAALIAAMKSGTEAVVTGGSSRGNTTKDTFSLLGFTAAVEDASRRCTG